MSRLHVHDAIMRAKCMFRSVVLNRKVIDLYATETRDHYPCMFQITSKRHAHRQSLHRKNNDTATVGTEKKNMLLLK